MHALTILFRMTNLTAIWAEVWRLYCNFADDIILYFIVRTFQRVWLRALYVVLECLLLPCFNTSTSIFFDKSNLSPFPLELEGDNRLMRVPCTRFKINPKLVLLV